MTATITPPAPTQVRRPWRTTLRTAFQFVVGLAPIIPVAVAAVEQDNAGLLGAAGAGAVLISTAVTRVMAIPAVNLFLTRYGFGATPAPVVAAKVILPDGTVPPTGPDGLQILEPDLADASDPSRDVSQLDRWDGIGRHREPPAT